MDDNMKPYMHGKVSVKKFGGEIADYQNGYDHD